MARVHEIERNLYRERACHAEHVMQSSKRSAQVDVYPRPEKGFVGEQAPLWVDAADDVSVIMVMPAVGEEASECEYNDHGEQFCRKSEEDLQLKNRLKKKKGDIKGQFRKRDVERIYIYFSFLLVHDHLRIGAYRHRRLCGIGIGHFVHGRVC